MKGIVKFFKEDKGFGFINCKSGDIFFHISKCISSDIKTGDDVVFDVVDTKKGKNTINICKESDIVIGKRIRFDTKIIVDFSCNGRDISEMSFIKSISDNVKKELNNKRIVKFAGISESGKAIMNVSCEDISDKVFLSHNLDDEREVIEKINPEIINLLEEKEKEIEEESKKKELSSLKRQIDFIKNNERNFIKKFLKETKEVFNVKFPKVFEDKVESIRWRNDRLHWDVSKKLSSFTNIDEDMFISENDIFSESEDNSFEIDDEISRLKSIRNKEISENRKLFNSVFDIFSTKCIITDEKGEIFERTLINKRFEETFNEWLIDWVEAIRELDDSNIRRDIDWLEDKAEWGVLNE